LDTTSQFGDEKREQHSVDTKEDTDIVAKQLACTTDMHREVTLPGTWGIYRRKKNGNRTWIVKDSGSAITRLSNAVTISYACLLST
jgi:hypothetical protein